MTLCLPVFRLRGPAFRAQPSINDIIAFNGISGLIFRRVAQRVYAGKANILHPAAAAAYDVRMGLQRKIKPVGAD